MTNQKKKMISIAAAMGAFIILFIATCSPSEEKILEKHCGEFVQSEFEQVDWNKPDEAVIGRNIARELARDVDSLRNYTMSPQNKYGFSKMYCTATATHALRDAQTRMNAKQYGINVFQGAPKYHMTNGYILFDYMRKTYEKDIPGSVVVIRNPRDMKISKMEKQIKNVNPGAMVRYYGHYSTGKSHAHTQTYLGRGYCNDGCFVPNKRGRTVMGAGYNDAFKYLQDDIEKYRQPCDARHAEPDSIVFLDMAKIMAAQAKQNQQ